MTDLPEKYVNVGDFTKDELQQVENKLESLGYNPYDLVSYHYDVVISLGRGHKYGVDTDGDTVFVLDVYALSYSPQQLTRDEYLKLLGLTFEDTPTSATRKLYKIVETSGYVFYYDSKQAVADVMRACDPTSARRGLATIIIDPNENVVKSDYTDQAMLEANFEIEEI